MPGCTPILMVHGGAGDWRKASSTRLIGAKHALLEAVETGFQALLEEGAVEAVVHAVKVMEDSGFFNAGKGSVGNAVGEVEMDAGVMDGYKGDAGGVALIKGFPNPVLIALEVMRDTPHVILAGSGAEEFALMRGFRRDESLLEKRFSEKKPSVSSREDWIGDTVGAVAVDMECRTAAAASTGGLRGKMKGRIGDSPLPGMGFYADKRGAVAATGIGEAIIMSCASRRLVELYEKHHFLREAGRKLFEEYEKHYRKGSLGIIAVTVRGEHGRFYNTRHLPVAVMKSGWRSPRLIGFPRFSQE